MLYIDFAINKEDILSKKEKKFPRIIRKLLYFIKNTTGQVLKYKLENNSTVIVLPKITNKTLKKLNKILRTDVTKNVCICDELLNNYQFIKYINTKELNVIDGRWLFKYMMIDTVKYICKELNVLPEKQEVSILTNENDINIFESIAKLSESVKNINIITREPKKFKKLEEKIYHQNGLIINVTNNLKTAMLKSIIILNLNFVQEDINRIILPRNSIIVNFENNVKIVQKGFSGVNCQFYNISLPTKYFKMYKQLSHFNSVNLYESFIYKKTMIQNIWKEIKEDDVKILCLEGKNGMIRFINSKKELKIDSKIG